MVGVLERSQRQGCGPCNAGSNPVPHPIFERIEMATPLVEHLDTAIKDLQNMRDAERDAGLKKDLNEEDRKRFLNIFLSKAKQQITMMELYLK